LEWSEFLHRTLNDIPAWLYAIGLISLSVLALFRWNTRRGQIEVNYRVQLVANVTLVLIVAVLVLYAIYYHSIIRWSIMFAATVVYTFHIWLVQRWVNGVNN